MKVLKMLKSFRYAGNGFLHLLKSENNFKFHLLVTILVVFLAAVFRVSKLEWALLVFQISFVFMAEAFNTSIEKLCDFNTRDFNKEIGVVKDLAAAGVLIAAISSIIIAVLIFGERILNLF
jgi:diacylglycerol kinase